MLSPWTNIFSPFFFSELYDEQDKEDCKFGHCDLFVVHLSDKFTLLWCVPSVDIVRFTVDVRLLLLSTVGSLEKHGSIIAHLLSQVRIGMDLTKVVLPTFILERRSLLEMYADFFAHPDLFVKYVLLLCRELFIRFINNSLLRSLDSQRKYPSDLP